MEETRQEGIEKLKKYYEQVFRDKQVEFNAQFETQNELISKLREHINKGTDDYFNFLSVNVVNHLDLYICSDLWRNK